LYIGGYDNCKKLYDKHKSSKMMAIEKGSYSTLSEIARDVCKLEISDSWLEKMLEFLQRELNIPNLTAEHIKQIDKLCSNDNFKLQLYLAGLRK